ncbi:radical SAM protein [Eubacteriales bacterium OttesenSCG-928-M02]|nr:radical SAM protein [Eubacteriales bacterium OttesenSCG-928-M02]
MEQRRIQPILGEDILQKLYVESSTLCNLACTMCMRNTWKDEQMGHLDFDLYKKVIQEAANIPTIHTVFFGGVGEPTFHPRFTEMVALAKAAGKRVECVTNGTLLNKEYITQLITAGLDMAWVSVDGLDEMQYESIRKNGHYATVYENLLTMKDLRETALGKDFEVGLSFVAMRENIGQLGRLMSFAWEVKANDVKITNLLPYTEESAAQSLIWQPFNNRSFLERNPADSLGGQPIHAHVDFPVMTLDEDTIGPIANMLRRPNTFSLMGDPIRRKTGYCKFVQEGNAFLRWDGEICPCMGLLHNTEAYIYKMDGFTRQIKEKSYGNVAENTLMEIWQGEDYTAFRQRVLDFSFSYCYLCGGCHRVLSNEEDCFQNQHPCCGACLWAQGFVQCP